MKHLTALLAIWVLMALVYSGSLNGQFVFDDPLIIPATHVPAAFHGPRWFSELTYRWDYLIAGESPFQFHRTGLLIHALNAAAVYGVAFYFLGTVPALIGAAAFAVHPVFAQEVQYISARPSALAALFTWAGVLGLLYLRGYWRHLAIGLCAYLAFASKEEGLLLIPIALTVQAIIQRRGLGWVALSGVMSLGALRLAGYPLLSNLSPLTGHDLDAAGLSMSVTRWQHVQIVVNGFIGHLLPNFLVPLRLSPDPPVMIGSWLLFGSGCLLLALLTAGLLSPRLDFRIRAAIAFLLLSPPLARAFMTVADTNFEYRGYFCGLGVALILGGLVYAWPRLVPMAVPAILGLAVLTMGRHTVWMNGVNLWESATHYERTARSLNNLGSAYMSVGRIDDAMKVYQEAIARQPRLPIAEANLGTAYAFKQNYPEALKHFDLSVTESPTFEQAWSGYAAVLLRMGRPMEAKAMASRALTLNPSSQMAQVNFMTANYMMKRQQP